MWGATTLEGGRGEESADERGAQEEPGREGREEEDEREGKEECEGGVREGKMRFTALSNICEKVGW